MFSQQVLALECKPGFTYNDQKELEQIKNLCEQKLASLSNQRNTLLSEIQYMDTQVYLTGLKIQETETKIDITQNEINSLSTKIEGLDESLNLLSKTLIKRVVSGYKQHSLSTLSLLLDSNGATDFLLRYKYLKTAQENNQKLLIQVQSTKTNFEEQKKMREEKKIELASLSTLLINQKADLINQQAAKQRLLIDTQNSETVYQQLLAQAQRQLSAFSSFVKSSGASSVIGANAFGNGSDGNYFSQRDERWASSLIGLSDRNILDVGCLLTSVAMVLKRNGVDTNPQAIASNPNYFDLTTANMKYRWNLNPWPNGLNSYHIDTSQVDEELNNNHYVIVGINYGACQYMSDHFVVITKKEGNEYKMHDPLYGPDINFSSHYSTICWAEVFK